MFGTQCTSQGAPLGICPQAGDVLATGSAAAAVPPTARAADAATPGAAPANPLEPPVSAAPEKTAAPEEAAAALSVHDLIEASHERLLLAQAKRPLFGDSPGVDGDEGDGGGPAAASPAQLSYAAAPAPANSLEPPANDRVAAPSIRAEFGTALPPTALPDEADSAPVETAGVGGPLLPPLPEPEPLSLPFAGPDAGETPDTAAAEARDAAPAATAVRIGESGVNIRSGPSTEDARLFGLEPGEQVMDAESSADWTKIEDAAGRTGWVLSELLAEADDAVVAETATLAAAPAPEPPAAAPAPEAPSAAAPADTDIRTVAGSGVSVREAPSNSGARLFALAAGEEVIVTGSDKGWLQIVDGRGRTGWAYSDFLAPKS